MEIITNRLILRSFQIEDVYDVFEYSKNPNVGLSAAWAPHPNIDYSILIVKKFIRKNEIAICLKDSNKVIGSIGIMDVVNKELTGKELSFALSEEYWGQGIMKEALNFVIPYIVEQYNTDKIYCCCFLENERSHNVMKGLGFKELGKYLYDDIPDSEPKEVMYYELQFDDFYHFEFTFSKEQYIEFRNLVGWCELEDFQIDNLIENSTYKIAIYNKGVLLGLARCISDNSYIYLLCDVMVHPNSQGKGIGKKMIDAFIKHISHEIGNHHAKLYIMSLKGKEGFYETLGFSGEYATGLTIVLEKDEDEGN